MILTTTIEQAKVHFPELHSEILTGTPWCPWMSQDFMVHGFWDLTPPWVGLFSLYKFNAQHQVHENKSIKDQLA